MSKKIISTDMYSLKIDNLGIINHVNIDFGPLNLKKDDKGSINLVAGINGSGKTTVSKILYSILSSFSNEADLMYNKKLNTLFIELINNISEFSRKYFPLYEDPFSDESPAKLENLDENLSEKFYHNMGRLQSKMIDMVLSKNKQLGDILPVVNDLEKFFSKYNVHPSKIEDSIDNIKKGIEKKKDEFHKIHETIPMFLSGEFGDSYLDFFNNPHEYDAYALSEYEGNPNSNISISSNNFEEKPFLKIASKLPILKYSSEKTPIKFGLKKLSLSYNLNNFNIGDVYYLETPYILDFHGNGNSSSFETYHQRSLIRKLSKKTSPEWQFNGNNTEFTPEDKIHNMIEGNIYYDEKKGFMFKNLQGDFIARNTAAGIKSIGILLALLEKKLDDNSFLIMDEPEVHLHPQWQIILAETIVFIAKTRKIHFYINSHSPQFIEAIDTYAKFYEILDSVNYHLTEADGEKFNIIKIMPNDLVKIYDHLGDPYDELDSIRGKTRARNALKD